ncbi:MAG: serine/threonine protein kinase [Myxococcales bacterium]|nr:serine/threonine protein kinase [Myxococcales bacterium]
MRGELVAGRYLVADALGSGAEATVFRAEDTVSGRQVALKVGGGASGLGHHRLLGEAAVLRLLRVGGVAHVLDAGVHEGRDFHITELVDGTPFPGKPPPVAWRELQPAACALLDTLERVHGAGIVHADLKPANVLVTHTGRPVVLDFGASRRTTIDLAQAGEPAVAGALAFLAPEVLRGARPSVASDLYAIGTMLYLAMTGTLPHPGTTPSTILRARLGMPAARLPAGCAPEYVETTVADLLHGDPGARPKSAAAARGALLDPASEHRPREATVLLADGGWTEEALRELFLGDERLFHLRTDAARILHRAGGGDSGRIAGVLTEWVEAGVVRPSQSRYWIDRQSLVDLQEAENARSERDGSVAERVLATAKRAVEAGDAVSAVSMLEVGARALRECSSEMAAVRDDVFVSWLELAVSEQSPHGADRLAYEAAQHRSASAVLSNVSTMAHALVSFAGDPRRALEELQRMGEIEPPRVERCRVSLAMLAARSIDVGTEQAILAAAEAYGDRCGDPIFLARLDGWRGRLAYREGRYVDAAELHRRSAERMTNRVDVVLAQLNRAAALVEAFDFRAARQVASTAREALGQARHPLFEARLEWVARTCSYRLEEDLAPDLELVDASARLGVAHMEAQLALTEAAFAWRGGQLETALALAARAEHLWRQVNTLVDLAWCVRALQLVCGDPRSADVAREIAAHACRSEIPGVGIQTLGLLALAGHEISAVHRDQVQRLAATVPAHFHRYRIDVLSVDEALIYLGADRR